MWHALTVRRLWLVVGGVAVVAAVVIGLSQAGTNEKPVNRAPLAAEVTRAFRGSPAPLAALHAQANQLLTGGGLTAVKARIKALRGYPIVINKWASWCGPCRFEFPFLQVLAVRYGRRVAFLGLNADDNDGDARGFLKRFPVTYPSYSDPDLSVVRALGISQQANPSTLFLDSRGQMSYQHQGAYAHEQDFAADIRQYALGIRPKRKHRS
jgi:cytochrome c biogenesis protein CcmG/thiol:disulfide interchange protein DsbE